MGSGCSTLRFTWFILCCIRTCYIDSSLWYEWIAYNSMECNDSMMICMGIMVYQQIYTFAWFYVQVFWSCTKQNTITYCRQGFALLSVTATPNASVLYTYIRRIYDKIPHRWFIFPRYIHITTFKPSCHTFPDCIESEIQICFLYSDKHNCMFGAVRLQIYMLCWVQYCKIHWLKLVLVRTSAFSWTQTLSDFQCHCHT